MCSRGSGKVDTYAYTQHTHWEHDWLGWMDVWLKFFHLFTMTFKGILGVHVELI